ncbi:Luciferin 4-monooxygenase [Gryllus bimaculatus]|nr:Luciferin 4-monooxygenase [Gryllus bimaculatus]
MAMRWATQWGAAIRSAVPAHPPRTRFVSTSWAHCRRWRSSGGGGDGGAPRVSYWHQPGSEALKPLTVGQLVEQAAQLWPEGEALVDRLAAALMELGLEPGSRIGIWGPNSSEWYITSLAASRAGLILVTINPAYQASELEYCLQKVRIKALVAAENFKSQHYYNMVQSIAPELNSNEPGMLRCEKVPSLTSVIIMSNNKYPGAFRFSDVSNIASESTVNKVRELQSSIQPDEPANIQFTSGTTGKPKAAVLSHHNIINNSYLVGKRFNFNSSSRICLQVPLFHCYGFCNGLLASLHHGATLVMPAPQFTAQSSLKTLQDEACTAVYGTPTMYVDLVNLAKKSAQPLSTNLQMALSSGSPCSPHLFQQIKETFKLKKVCSVYGLTETSPVVFQSLPTDNEEHMTSTIGHVSEHVEAKVVDRSGKMVPLGTPGELWLRGYFCMLGYWEDKAKTEEAISPEGWFKTGDQFVLREDGYGQVVGRLKDVIIRGGENIYPKEVEEFLEKHPEVLEAQVFGLPDARLGEVVCACLRLKENTVVSDEAIKQFCKGKIAHYKIPFIIKFVSEFPKTVSGKIQKFRLKEMVMNEQDSKK